MNWIGIDISKDQLEVYARPSGESGRFDNDQDGRNALRKWLRRFADCHVVMEPTGGYELALCRELYEAKVPFSVVNARQIRNFARATGQLAKTDKTLHNLLEQASIELSPASLLQVISFGGQTSTHGSCMIEDLLPIAWVLRQLLSVAHQRPRADGFGRFAAAIGIKVIGASGGGSGAEGGCGCN